MKKLIVLLVIFAAALGCRKKEMPAPASYTSKIGGFRKWHGSYLAYKSTLFSTINIVSNTPEAVNDSFEIATTGDSIVSIKGKLLRLDSLDGINSILFYSDGKTAYNDTAYTLLKYYYKADSLSYDSRYNIYVDSANKVYVYNYDRLSLSTP